MSQGPRFESEILNASHEFLLKNGLKESTCADYCRRIQAICKQFHITPDELFEGRAEYSIDDLIGVYTNHPEMKAENAKKHNAPLSALKWFKKYWEIRQKGHLQNKIVGETIYIKYAPFYQSFEIKNRHVSGFTIQNRYFKVTYKQNRRVCDIVEKQINDKNYSDLIAVMCRYKNYLNDSKKSAREMFPHGGACAIEYRFEDKYSVFGGVWPLFVGGKTAEKADAEFRTVIENIINQPGGKSVPVSAIPAGDSVSAPTAPATGKMDIMADAFWRDFAEFLRDDGLIESSIRCYIEQYLKKAFEKYLGKDILELSELNDEAKIDTVKNLHSRLSKAILLGTGPDSKKTQRNYSSAATKLEVFLDERLSELSKILPAAEEVPVPEEELVPAVSEKAPYPRRSITSIPKKIFCSSSSGGSSRRTGATRTAIYRADCSISFSPKIEPIKSSSKMS